MLSAALLVLAFVAEVAVLPAERLYDQGVAFGVAGSFAEAEQRFREALVEDPHHIPSKRALEVLDDRAGELVSRESALLIFEGLAAQRRLDWAGARDHYRQALKRSPRYALALHNLGVALGSLGATDAAIAAYREALDWNPSYPYTHNNLGLLYASLGEDERACSSYRAAIELDADYYKAYNNLGASLWKLGKKDEAEALFKKALEIKPDYVLASAALRSFDPPHDPRPPGAGAPSTAALLAQLESTSYETRTDGVRGLVERNDPSALPELLALLEDERPVVRSAALHVLGHLRDARAIDPAIEALRGESDWALRRDAIRVLCWARDPRVVPALVSTLGNDKDPKVRAEAAWALHAYPGCDSLRALAAALKDPVPEVRDQARGILEFLKADPAHPEPWLASACGSAAAPTEP
jgi:tetratricopeptide (TPR) repeat protein